MTGKTERRVGEIGSGHSRYVILPRMWCDGSGITRGTRVSVLFDGVLVIVPPRMGRAAERILAAMRSEGT
jgi:hypothetical protein